MVAAAVAAGARALRKLPARGSPADAAVPPRGTDKEASDAPPGRSGRCRSAAAKAAKAARRRRRRQRLREAGKGVQGGPAAEAGPQPMVVEPAPQGAVTQDGGPAALVPMADAKSFADELAALTAGLRGILDQTFGDDAAVGLTVDDLRRQSGKIEAVVEVTKSHRELLETDGALLALIARAEAALGLDKETLVILIDDSAVEVQVAAGGKEKNPPKKKRGKTGGRR